MKFVKPVLALAAGTALIVSSAVSVAAPNRVIGKVYSNGHVKLFTGVGGAGVCSWLDKHHFRVQTPNGWQEQKFRIPNYERDISLSRNTISGTLDGRPATLVLPRGTFKCLRVRGSK